MSSNGKEAHELGRIRAAQDAIRESVEDLAVMMSNKNYDIRMEALEALATCDSQMLEIQVRKAIRDSHELVRTTAMEIAEEKRLVAVQGEILRQLRSEKSWLVRSAAAIALAEMNAVDSISVIEKMLVRANKEERFKLYYALAKLGRLEYLPSFLGGLFHNCYRIRCATANLLSGIVDGPNKDFVRHLLNDALKREKTVAARESLKDALKELG